MTLVQRSFVTALVGALFACAPVSAFAEPVDTHQFKPQPAQGDWWCYSDGAQATIYISAIDNVATFQTDIANAFAQALAKRYGYKSGANCAYWENTATMRKRYIEDFKASGKTVIDTGWTLTSNTIVASPTVYAPPPPPPAAPAPQAPAKNPYICLDNTEGAAGQSGPATFYVTEAFDSSMPPTDLVLAWRAYLTSHYQLANAETGNCMRRTPAQREQLEARLAKAKGPVVRVNWKP